MNQSKENVFYRGNNVNLELLLL